ncbi:hypothetical protein U2A4042360006 [Corynebacterium striatum]|nr:hypothetical protein U2A4042360006 [Corynebacterium striatum]
MTQNTIAPPEWDLDMTKAGPNPGTGLQYGDPDGT